MNIRIEVAALRYLAPHVSTKESRPILNGVLLEPNGVGVATDGITLVAHKGTAEGVTAPLIVRFHKIADALKIKAEYVVLTVDGNGPQSGIVATVHTSRGGLVSPTMVDIIEGPYPTWRQAVPRAERTPAGTIAYSPDVFVRFAKSSPKPFTLTLDNDARQTLVTWAGNPDAFGLVMPYKDKGATEVPSWVAESLSWAPLAYRAAV